ncbi:hypothetical protein NEOLEDRAFT_174033 [Neolentinus lepideus HHB14362 ss-1]|uniref:Uncharacterized protein n=1 Tax=Neolentinus lepideus HHB14362 ss-1 TaxID=1314782 RepID=A0A165MHY9_9AGAM|nr:hypothetical protein NEOLEDRAFT_174033 [Neolentinus lepideus HHB14362 ss-1]
MWCGIVDRGPSVFSVLSFRHGINLPFFLNLLSLIVRAVVLCIQVSRGRICDSFSSIIWSDTKPSAVFILYTRFFVLDQSIYLLSSPWKTLDWKFHETYSVSVLGDVYR